MSKLECPVVESLFRDLEEAPVLSVVIPTYNRTSELVVAASSVAEQLTGGLEKKVEIIISDNASASPTLDVIRALAEKYPTVSYLVHARDEGGFFQFFAAPWRARGRWTWVFGSDDALLAGGIAHIVDVLEREQPGFLGLNKRIMNGDLSLLLNEGVNTIPDRSFDSFTDMFCALGVNQFAFISANIERTEAARRIDPKFYLTADTRHPHLVAFLEKHHGDKACYSAANHLIHRIDNSPMVEYHAGNFFDYGVTLPYALSEVAAKIGAAPDLFERITGEKFITSYDPPGITFVDAMLENILRALTCAKYMTVGHRYKLETILASCHPRRAAQFVDIWKLHQQMAELDHAAANAKAKLEQAQRDTLDLSLAFTRR